MSEVSPEKRAEWNARAARKGAIVPKYFEVSPQSALIECGKCGKKFQRNLVPNVNEPTFVCPEPSCAARNWIPVRFDLK